MRIVIEIPPADVLALEHDLADIEGWVRAALAGKVDSCRTRMAEEAAAMARDGRLDLSTIGSEMTNARLAAALAAHPDYLNCAARQAKEAADRAKRAEEAEAARRAAEEAGAAAKQAALLSAIEAERATIIAAARAAAEEAARAIVAAAHPVS